REGVGSCPQHIWSPIHGTDAISSTNEDDCLYLNIWRPGHLDPECGVKPVVVVLHGGRFQFGGGGTYTYYNGQNMAAFWDVVVVAPAYRVGVFGFLNAMVPEAPGNVGLLDQAVALRWVRRHITSFGGDNKRVTLLGHEAGASSVGFHLSSNERSDLFHRVILMSGSPFSPVPSNSDFAALHNLMSLANLMGCRAPRWDVNQMSGRRQIVECLRKQSVESTVIAANQLALCNEKILYGPSLVADYPRTLRRQRKSLKPIDVLLGSTKDEGTIYVSETMLRFGLVADQTLTVDKMIAALRELLGAYGVRQADLVVDYYGFNNFTSNTTSAEILTVNAAKLIGDFFVYCPAIYFLEESFAADSRLFFYEFDYNPGYKLWPAWQGVPQFLDFFFAAGLLGVLEGKQDVREQDWGLASDMIAVFSAFARTGNPNTLPNLIWHRWSRARDGPLILDYSPNSVYTTASSLRRSKRCDFWRQFF
ncbi:unnamed protein product, partial [Ixodes hexagonus]